VQLGESAIEYKTQTMGEFAKPTSKPAVQQPVYKNYNEKVDLISGATLDKNQKTFGFERFTEKNHHLKSGNQSYFPQDLWV
jgi:hypothetical protein